MEYLLGYFFLLIVFIFIIFLTTKYPHIKNILLIAFFTRLFLVLLNEHSLIYLPDSNGDAIKFEHMAREFSNKNGVLILIDFFKADSFLISRIISIFYTIFGESKLLASGISVALGTTSVFLIYYLSNMIWDHDSAKKSAWVVALFPTLILYSCLTLRESYIVFFLLIGLISLVKSIKNNSLNSYLITMISFYILMLFHGPLLVGGLIFITYLILSLIMKQYILIKFFKINIIYSSLLIVSLIPMILFLSNNLTMPYIGGFYNLFNLDELLTKTNSFITGTGAYPSWLVINTNQELFLKGIIKIFYFLYSPFIWDIKTFFHIIGLFDAMLYFILTIYVIKNWYVIWSNPITRVIILIFFCYLITYGVGTGNFGTGVRHRSKFVVILIVLAAPKIHKFIFSGKKKLYKK